MHPQPVTTVPNAFLLYMPPGNDEAMIHYQDTIVNRVPLNRITPHVSASVRDRLISIFGLVPIAVWGSAGGTGNRRNFERMSSGDDVLIVEGDTIKLIAKVAAKVESAALSSELWHPIRGDGSTTWELIYFLANPRELNVPFAEFCSLFGYADNYRLRGFTAVSPERMDAFYARYDDLYSVLERIQLGKPIAERRTPPQLITQTPPEELVELTPEELERVIDTPLAISDHVRMQWKLARLGLKAGERVWVPVGDQQKLRQTYDFAAFDAEFASGIDLPHSYLENIDVVWKHEFRIGAAYEIENSTSIYSGLLRFADLNIVAPNTLYPMFIVAPRDKKGRLLRQLQRPAFRRLELDKKVRFLSYEAIDEIDDFFAHSASGLNIDIIVSKSENAA